MSTSHPQEKALEEERKRKYVDVSAYTAEQLLEHILKDVPEISNKSNPWNEFDIRINVGIVKRAIVLLKGSPA